MRHEPKFARLLLAAFLLISQSASWCAAQYRSGNDGIGNGPMAPAEPAPTYRPDTQGPPTQPGMATRPSTWPGGESAMPQQGAQNGLPPAEEITACEGSRILAHVGSEVIIESDLAGVVNEIISANKDQIPPGKLDEIREDLVKKHLKYLIQGKLIFLDAKHSIPSEGWPQIQKKVDQTFEDNEIFRLMKQTKARSRKELDDNLRKLGTSLEREKMSFFERELAKQWLMQQIKREDEITYDQMVTYYRQHIAEFTTPAKAKWEEVMVRSPSLKYPNDDAAYAALAQMGNQILAGANLSEVAKAASDGATARKGGAWDWTIKGSLVCKEIDAALFSLPVGQPSRIIKSANGFHIVRVTSREDAKVAPFLDAQVDIREKIVKQRFEKQRLEYLAKIEARTPVTTIFDAKEGPGWMLSSRPDSQQSSGYRR